MPNVPDLEQAFPSTTYAWKPVKVKRRPQGTPTARAKRGRWWGLATWPRQRPLSLTITWRGGPESYWLVETRGRHGVFAGCSSLDDVMTAVANEWNGPSWLPGKRGGPPAESIQ